MPAPRPNRKILAAATLLTLAAAVFFFHLRARERRLDQIACRQQALTAQAADVFEEHLFVAQTGLRHLARRGPDLLRQGESAAGELELLSHPFGSGAFLAAYLRDPQGRIVAEYPPRGLSASGVLLPSLAPAKLSCSADILRVGDIPFLRLYRPFPTEGGGRAELGLLIRLDRFRDDCLRSLEGAADFHFLLDESGRFVLHRERALAGSRLESAFSDNPSFSRFLAGAARGDFGRLPYFGLASPDPRSPKVLLTCAPVDLPGSRLSLGLGMPSGLSASLDRTNALFVFSFASLFLFSALLALPASRLLDYPRRLEEERKRRQEETAELRTALTGARRRAQHLLDNAGDAIFFIDPEDGSLLEVNRRGEELLGYRPDEISRLPLADLFPGRERRRYLRLVKRVLRNGYGEERRLLFRCKDGRQFVGEVHARLGELGERQVAHGVLRDTTEIHRIETELRRKNRDLTLINDIAHHASESRDLQEMLYPALHKILHAFAGDGGGIYLVGEENEDLHLVAHQGIPEELRREIDRLPAGEGLVGRVAVSGQPKTAADVGRDQRIWSDAARRSGWKGVQAIPLAASEKTAGVLFLFSRSRPVLGRDDMALLLTVGKQIGTAIEGARLFAALERQVRLTRATNRDLEHSRRQLRENLAALEDANRAMAQLDRMKSNFLTLASHELRTPLTYILSGAELLAATLNLSEEEKHTLDVVVQGGSRLKEIVEDLLEAARIESKTLYLAREQVDLPDLLSGLCEGFRPVLAERGLTIDLQPFPPAPFLGDAHHLKRTFQRLLENAVKFTPEGGHIGIRAEIRAPADLYRQAPLLRPFSPAFFTAALCGEYLQVTVRDSGVGIEPDDHVRIFDKFYEIGDINSHSTSRTRFGGKGVGLGLTLVKGMVEAHGGMVWVESAGSGGGSAFHVLLPLAAGREPGDGAG